MHYIFLTPKIHLMLGLMMSAAVFFGSISSSPLPDTELIPGSDKLIHVMAYGILSLWFAQLISPKNYVRLAVALLLYGGFIELVQGQLPYRSASMLDLLANLVGILSALFICACITKFSTAKSA